MILESSWRLQESEKWNQTWSRLINILESDELCEFEYLGKISGNELYKVYLPGPDGLLLAAVDSYLGSQGVNHCTKIIRYYFWDRVELRINVKKATLQCRWVYWSPSLIFIHSMIGLVFIVESWQRIPAAELSTSRLILFLSLIFVNLLMGEVSRKELKKLEAFFRQVGLEVNSVRKPVVCQMS